MKNKKRGLRRYKSKCKFEKRLKLWVTQGSNFVTENAILYDIGGHELDIVRNEIRKGDFWTFLKDTSNQCSCYMCKGEKYKRPTKQELNNIIEEELYND